jgi:hypothetical protein
LVAVGSEVELHHVDLFSMVVRVVVVDFLVHL